MELTLRPRRDFHALTTRRLKAAALFTRGHPQAEIVRRLQVSRPTAHRWFQTWRRKGRGGLKGAGRAGRLPRLNLAAQALLHAALLKGPDAFGFSTHLWTLARVAVVIRRTCGVSYHPRHVWRILRQLGWSRQRPARRAKERNERAIAHFRNVTWVHVKKTPDA